jgi:hypothetical protein
MRQRSSNGGRYVNTSTNFGSTIFRERLGVGHQGFRVWWNGGGTAGGPSQFTGCTGMGAPFTGVKSFHDLVSTRGCRCVVAAFRIAALGGCCHRLVYGLLDLRDDGEPPSCLAARADDVCHYAASIQLDCRAQTADARLVKASRRLARFYPGLGLWTYLHSMRQYDTPKTLKPYRYPIFYLMP